MIKKIALALAAIPHVRLTCQQVNSSLRSDAEFYDILTRKDMREILEKYWGPDSFLNCLYTDLACFILTQGLTQSEINEIGEYR